MTRFTIQYQYGTYAGTRVTYAEDREQAVAKMWSEMARRGELGLPMAYQSAEVISEEIDSPE